MYTHQLSLWNGYTLHTITDYQSGHFFSVLPQQGALLQQMALSNQRGLHGLLEGLSPQELPSNSWYKSAILFPFAGRIADGQYQHQDMLCQLPVNEAERGNALHGLVYDKPFETSSILLSDQEGGMWLEYKSLTGFPGYPFPFALQLGYFLKAHAFHLLVKVENLGTQHMPLGFGWHPYFKTIQLVDECRMSIPSDYSLDTDNRLLPTGDKHPNYQFTPSLFREGEGRIGSLHLDTCYALNETDHKVRLADGDKTLCLELGKGFSYLQIFTPSHRQHLAIEPQTIAPNGFNTWQGLITLPAGQTWNGHLSLSLE